MKSSILKTLNKTERVKMRKVIILVVLIVSVSACSGFHLQAGTGDGIKRHWQGVSGVATVAKAKNSERIEKGYWQSISDEIKANWAEMTNTEESGS